MADLTHQWYDSAPGVDIVGIYVENHHGRCREFFIWIRFDNMKVDEKGSLPYLLQDPLISETCPLEESASHHDRLKKQTNAHDLPPSAGFWNVAGYDGAECLRKLVVGSSSRLPVRAHSVQIEEKEVPLDHHVQLPKSIPGAPSEERLKRKQSIGCTEVPSALTLPVP